MKAAWVAILTLALTILGIVYEAGNWRGTVEQRLSGLQQPGGVPIGERMGRLEERSVEVIRRLDRMENKIDQMHASRGSVPRDGRVEFRNAPMDFTVPGLPTNMVRLAIPDWHPSFK
jgi:hypothetical protein